ncbi:MAG TPA: hypothetical protein VK698_39685 [Kofleriaceae bacterium]|nr:hypothetical protein [Kofleriaceae bacterium]
MKQTTHRPAHAAEPATGWCHWHKGASETAVLVQIIEQASASGARLYACTPCREQHHLVPEAS